jgi:hypothetical protein
MPLLLKTCVAVKYNSHSSSDKRLNGNFPESE